MPKDKKAVSKKTETDDIDAVVKDFKTAVNMKASEIKAFLKTEDSQSVGWVNSGETESVGHKSGKKIVKLLRKKKAELTQADLAHMKKVVGYVHRHMKQKPQGDITDTRWRFSLMNWGHDPKKKAS